MRDCLDKLGNGCLNYGRLMMDKEKNFAKVTLPAFSKCNFDEEKEKITNDRDSISTARLQGNRHILLLPALDLPGTKIGLSAHGRKRLPRGHMGQGSGEEGEATNVNFFFASVGDPEVIVGVI